MEGQLSRELSFAPTDREGLLEHIGGLACDGACNYNVCMQDRHHTIFGSDLSEAEQLLKSHPDFILHGICRFKHIQLHREFNRSEPLNDQFVIDYMLASPVNMSKTRTKKLNRIRGQHG